MWKRPKLVTIKVVKVVDRKPRSTEDVEDKLLKFGPDLWRFSIARHGSNRMYSVSVEADTCSPCVRCSCSFNGRLWRDVSYIGGDDTYVGKPGRNWSDATVSRHWTLCQRWNGGCHGTGNVFSGAALAAGPSHSSQCDPR